MECSLSTTAAHPRSRTNAAGNRANPANASDFLPDRAKTVPDLIALANALDTMITIANALTSTSRMQDSRHRHVLNEAGGELDDITDILVERHVDVMGRLHEARAATKREAQDRACALLRWDLECDQDVTDVALSAVRKDMPERF